MKWAMLLAALLASGGCTGRGQVKTVAAPPPRPSAAEIEAVPTPTPIPALAAGPAREVEVQKGDSFWRIARRELGTGTRYAELAAFNSLDPQHPIQPRQRLKLPGGTAGARVQLPVKKKPGSYRWAKRTNRAYAVGEQLTFAVQYFSATAGYAVLSIPQYSVQQGRVTLHVVAEAKTHPFFETFFKVRDRIETFIDADALIPLRYEKHIREGGFSADAFYIFDQPNQKMIEPDKGKEVTVTAETQDVLSCFFWFRNQELVPGKDISVFVAADNMKSYELIANVLRKERISTLAGDFDCIVVQPHLKYDGIFQQKGEVFMWISDDERRLPVKIQTKIAIGSINITLKDAIWVKPD